MQRGGCCCVDRNHHQPAEAARALAAGTTQSTGGSNHHFPSPHNHSYNLFYLGEMMVAGKKRSRAKLRETKPAQNLFPAAAADALDGLRAKLLETKPAQNLFPASATTAPSQMRHRRRCAGTFARDKTDSAQFLFAGAGGRERATSHRRQRTIPDARRREHCPRGNGFPGRAAGARTDRTAEFLRSKN